MSPTVRRRWLRPWLVLPLAAIVGVVAWLAVKPGSGSASASPTTQTASTIEAAATDDHLGRDDHVDR